jgi:hypothetical protein
LEQSAADHEDIDITFIKVDPLLDPLRGDPRFEALVQKVVAPQKPEVAPSKSSPKSEQSQ